MTHKEKTKVGFKPLSSSELAICGRLAKSRRFEGLSQQEFAEQLGISRNQLANIESGRVPLKFRLGWRVCRSLNINPFWLAGSSDSQKPFRDYGVPDLDQRVRDDWPFSEIFLGTVVPLKQDAKSNELISVLIQDYNAAKIIRSLLSTVENHQLLKEIGKISLLPGLKPDVKWFWIRFLCEVFSPKDEDQRKMMDQISSTDTEIIIPPGMQSRGFRPKMDRPKKINKLVAGYLTLWDSWAE